MVIFFFQMGYQVENYYARGCQKKSAPFSPLVRPQWLFFSFFFSKQNLVAKSSEKKKLKLRSDSPVSQLSYGGSNFSVASKLWELKLFCPGFFFGGGKQFLQQFLNPKITFHKYVNTVLPLWEVPIIFFFSNGILGRKMLCPGVSTILVNYEHDIDMIWKSDDGLVFFSS